MRRVAVLRTVRCGVEEPERLARPPGGRGRRLRMWVESHPRAGAEVVLELSAPAPWPLRPVVRVLLGRALDRLTASTTDAPVRFGRLMRGPAALKSP